MDNKNKSYNHSLISSCPSRPNCISSNSKNKKNYIEPIFFTVSVNKAFKRLENIVSGIDNTILVKKIENKKLHYECISNFFKFRDDLEFVFDSDNKAILIRSSSRIGYYDFNVNRIRVVAIKELFDNQI